MRYLRLIMILVLLVGLTLGLFFQWNARFSYLQSGTALPQALGDEFYSLIPAEDMPGLYVFYAAPEMRFSILVITSRVSAPYMLRDGNGLLRYAYDGQEYLAVFFIDESFYDAKQGAFVFSLQMDGGGMAVLGSGRALERARLNYIFVQVLVLGMLLLIFLQALYLYYKKPTELYLRHFSMYILVLFLWGLMRINVGPGYAMARVLDPFGEYIYQFMAALTCSTCYSLLGIRLRGKWDALTRWYVLFPLLLTLMWASPQLFPGIRRAVLYESLRMLLYGFTAAGLLYGCAHHIRGSKVILVGFAISWGLRLVIFATQFQWILQSYLLMTCRTTRLIDLPLVLSFVLYTNSTFAEKFKDAEKLSVELAEANASLDKKVALRTQELVEQQQQRHSMMMNIFHDLRNPLFIVKGCTELIPVESPKAREKLAIMKERLNFAMHLTEELFLVAKLEEHQVLFVEDPYDLAALLRAEVDSAAISAAAKDIALLSDIPGSYRLNGDAYRIAQAFQNLVLNAIHFTSPGGRVTIRLWQDDAAAFVVVADTGKGMDMADSEKVFTRFYRVEESRSSASTGLGLSIAKEIIAQHGGSIRVQSEKGVGTMFTVTLPKG